MSSVIKPSEALENLTVLYVGNNNSTKEKFVFMIKKYIKKIYTTDNTKDGLNIFARENIDLIVGDVESSVDDSIKMAAKIKYSNRDIPIVFLISLDDKKCLKEVMNIGVDSYIVKPIEKNSVLKKINSIAEWVVTKKESKKYVTLIKTLFDYQDSGLVLFDDKFNIKLYNKSFKKMYKNVGIKKPTTIDDLVGFCSDDENDKLLDKKAFLKMIDKKNIVKCDHYGCIKYYEVELKKIQDYILMNVSDVTDIKIESELLKNMAMKDELTGLYNRKKLEIEIEKIQNTQICITIFDIDDFKKINDTYGHLAGDKVLRILSNTIRNNLRKTDLVVRWGGEEFLVILSGIKDEDKAMELANKLREAIYSTNIENIGHISCSFGVCCGKGEDFEKLLKIADEALYKAKNNGKNRVEFCNLQY